MAIPAAYQLHLAGVEIDWLCGPAVLPVLELYPWIHAMVADEAGLLTGSKLGKMKALGCGGGWRGGGMTWLRCSTMTGATG